MTFLPATVLRLFLVYLVSAEGSLSPPINLSVELLDFQTSVHWLPGPGNPRGTRYFVEFTDIQHFSKSAWNRSAECTNITSTQCHLTLDQLFTNYFVKVMAEWREERSNWTSLPHTFQLYKDTQLSPPNMRILREWHSIQINLSHRAQSVRDVPLRFSIDLFQMSDHRGQSKLIGKKTSAGSSNFSHLPSGFYCINASAFHTQMSPHRFLNATTCISMERGHRGGFAHISLALGVGVLLLLTVPIGIILRTNSYVRSYICTDTLPEALVFSKGSATVPKLLNSEELPVLPQSVAVNPHAVDPALEVDENVHPDYLPRIANEHGFEDELEDDHVLLKFKEEGGMLPARSALYTSAVGMEDPEDLIQDEPLFHSCVLQMNLDFSPGFISGTPTFDGARQKTQASNLLISRPDSDANDNSKTENQLLSHSSSNHLKALESPEGETDSWYNAHSDYEPRAPIREHSFTGQ